MHKSVLWAEDLEGHRQPSLYYLDDDDVADGPHLICDWNGAPTDAGEFEIDAFSLIKEHEIKEGEKDEEEFFDARSSENSPDMNGQQQQQDKLDSNSSNEKFVDYPNPAAGITKRRAYGHNDSYPGESVPIAPSDLIVEDCAHLDFLSVPPITSGLLKRIVRNLQRNQKHGQLNATNPSVPTARASTGQKISRSNNSSEK